MAFRLRVGAGGVGGNAVIHDEGLGQEENFFDKSIKV